MPIPTTLRTPTPAEDHTLARQLPTDLLSALPQPATMADQLQTTAARPSPELVIAIYFHAIALANHGWGGAPA